MSVAIVSTRVLSKEQLALFEEQNLAVLDYDFIQFETIENEVNNVHDILLFTSKNAVEAVRLLANYNELVTKPVVCVGIKTKELLEQYGWTVMAWAHYAKDLATIIIEDFSTSSFTFFCGNLRRDLLPELFDERKIAYTEYEVYRTVVNAHQVVEKVDGICFYSPSGIASYLQNNSITNEVCFCIGDTTADALQGITEHIVLAEYPTIDATLAACVSYYKLSQLKIDR